MKAPDLMKSVFDHLICDICMHMFIWKGPNLKIDLYYYHHASMYIMWTMYNIVSLKVQQGKNLITKKPLYSLSAPASNWMFKNLHLPNRRENKKKYYVIFFFLLNVSQNC